MRRSAKWLFLAAVLTAAASASSASAVAQHVIVCPLDAKAVTCCPPAAAQPIACCGAAQCLGGVSIASSRNPSTAGGSVTVSGHVVNGATGEAVVLWQELPGGSFKQVAQTALDSSGGYSFVETAVNTNRAWYVTAGGIQSPTLSQEVSAIVTLTGALRVHVRPAHAGEKVLIQFKTAHGWKLLTRVKLNRSSRSSKSVSLTRFGHRTIRLRAVLPADSRNLRSLSSTIRVKA
jgi:hypothetical protein